ncbi:alpha/beta-hydrolase [Meredithblackwellia eburnea MCA 4105]
MTSSPALGKCCVSGHLHEGTPQGSVKQLDGLDVYVTGDPANKDKTIVYVTDIFGFQLNNARLLADEIAANGFYVVIPDLFKNDSLDGELILKIAPRTSLPERSVVQKGVEMTSVMASLGPWLVRQREAVVKPILESFVNELKKDVAIKKIGATGYCFGGRYSILLAHGLVDAAVACHPSFLGVPADIEGIKAPVSIAVGEKDEMFSAEDQEKTQALFNNELKGVPTQFKVYPDQVHGFAVRGDINVETEKAAKEAVTEQTVEWFKKHLA